MCRLLIMKVDQTDPDPEKDRKHRYKLGDCLDVLEDGATIPADVLDSVWIINCPGMPVADAKAIMTQTQLNPDYPGQIWRRRPNFFDKNKPPPQIVNRLEREGEITVLNWSTWVTWLTNKGY